MNAKNSADGLKSALTLVQPTLSLQLLTATTVLLPELPHLTHAIRDGVIVNYYESVQLVTKLKQELEEKLGTELLYGAAAIPPGVSEGSIKSIGYVLEGAGLEVTKNRR